MEENGDENALKGKKLSLPQFLALLERKSIIPSQFTIEQAKEKFASFANTDHKSLYFTEFRACMHSFYESSSSKKPQSDNNRRKEKSASRDSKNQETTTGKRAPEMENNGGGAQLQQQAEVDKAAREYTTDMSRKADRSPKEKPQSQRSELARRSKESNEKPDTEVNREHEPAAYEQRATDAARQASDRTQISSDGRMLREGERKIDGRALSREGSSESAPREEYTIQRSPKGSNKKLSGEFTGVNLELDCSFEEVSNGDSMTFCNDLVLDLADALAVNWDRMQVIKLEPSGQNTTAIVKFLPGAFDDEPSAQDLVRRLQELSHDDSDDNLLFNGEVTRFLLEVSSPINMSPSTSRAASASEHRSGRTLTASEAPSQGRDSFGTDRDGPRASGKREQSSNAGDAQGNRDLVVREAVNGRREVPNRSSSFNEAALGSSKTMSEYTASPAAQRAQSSAQQRKALEADGGGDSSPPRKATQNGSASSKRRHSVAQTSLPDEQAMDKMLSRKNSQSSTSKSAKRRHSIAPGATFHSEDSRSQSRKMSQNGDLLRTKSKDRKTASADDSRVRTLSQEAAAAESSGSSKFPQATVASMVFVDEEASPMLKPSTSRRNLDDDSARKPSFKEGSDLKRQMSRKKNASKESLGMDVDNSKGDLGAERTPEPPATPPADDGAAQWRVHMNNDQANTEEQLKAKQRGTEIYRNSVTTSKYTFYNFLFLNLGQQFSRLANVYFLIIAALQLFTPLSPTGRYSTAAPLALVVAANMVREIWEDSKRHQDDRQVNHRKVDVIKEGKVVSLYWKELRVGDLVCINKGNELPADVVQLSSSEDQGGSYIDTCNLDGETNLKIKSSLSATSHATSSDKIGELAGSLDYEPPNKRLYTFVGTASFSGEKVPVDNDCVLLRGSVLRNTAFIYGIVVYAGKQSKIQMNSKAAPIKRSNVERLANWILAGVLLFELVMCSLGCIGNAVWGKSNSGVWYMPYVQAQKTTDVLLAWVSYFILLNNYVPISLYVSMELAKLGQKVLMDNDLDMYHEPTDTPCLARTSNLNEELGQIQYIFSDKTGTLTRNEMEFRKCWIAGTSYGFGTTEIGQAAAARGALVNPAASQQDSQQDADPRKAQHFYDPKVGFDDVRLLQRLKSNHRDAKAISDFLRVLSVAHTVVPEGDDQGLITPDTIKFQAESPDEGALVIAAKVLGYFFCGKTSTTHTVNVLGDMQVFEILNINKFTSTRKRMSAVVRTPEGRLELYIKGADNVMFERLRRDEDIGPVEAAVKGYGQEGLRTLIIAKKLLSEEEYKAWSRVHRDASTALTGREDKLTQAAEAIERDLVIVGATAIEDKLQIGVPDAIATLARARIRIWVLTGDKQETAENIGFACNLLTDDMERVYLVQETAGELRWALADAIQRYNTYAEQEDPCEQLAVLVDGKALLVIMKAVENPSASAEEREMMLQFLALARMCKAVIACRVSPDQKRQIVAMVKLYSDPVPLTLAIGDGANDVPMILEASVGVGISGNEGMQAVRSADYAIAQFAYLKRLLLVHGRSNYKRVSTVVMYSLYKNSFLVSTLFLYSFYTGWTGTALYDSLMLAGFNVGWAFFGIILYGTIENDVSPAAALRFPQLYTTGVRKQDFNMGVLVRWELLAFVHTVVCLLIPVYSYMGAIVRRSGQDDGQTVFGMCVLQALVVGVNLKLLLSTANLSYLSVGAYLGGVVLFMFGGLTHSTWGLSSFFATEQFVFYNVMPFLYATPTTWLIQLLTVVVLLLPELMLTYYQRTYYPSPADVVREMDQGYGEALPAPAAPP